MKKTIVVVMLLIVCALTLIGCETGNRITSDVQMFNYAYVYLDGNKIVEGAVTQWRDYKKSDAKSDAVLVLIGGKYYLTHYANVVLIADPEAGSLHYSSGWNEYN